MEEKGKQRYSRLKEEQEAELYSGSESEEVEDILLRHEEHAASNSSHSLAHRKLSIPRSSFIGDPQSTNDAQSSGSSCQLESERKHDPYLLIHLLGVGEIKEVLLYYLERSELAALARTCHVLYLIVSKGYLKIHKPFTNFRLDRFSLFARGCWEFRGGEIGMADRTSVVYHLMNERMRTKYTVFNGYHFVAVPRKYLEDLVKMCWTIAAIVARTHNSTKSSHRVYHYICRAISDAFDTRTAFNDMRPRYIVGEHYLFSHEHSSPFRFDKRIPSRCSSLVYSEIKKAEKAMLVLCGERVEDIDHTTNLRLKLHRDETIALRKDLLEGNLTLPIFSVVDPEKIKQFYAEWKFCILSDNDPVPLPPPSAPIEEPAAPLQPTSNEGCLIT